VLIFGLSHFYRRAENWLGVTTETYHVIFGISDLAIFLDLRSLWSLPYGTLIISVQLLKYSEAVGKS
jgi:hypothetical protein